MYNPKDIFTEDGYDEYKAHIHNIEEGLFYIYNHMDDLHLDSDDFYDVYHKFNDLIPLLKKGDGEVY
jgi:hypothetical protein